VTMSVRITDSRWKLESRNLIIDTSISIQTFSRTSTGMWQVKRRFLCRSAAEETNFTSVI
jgi:hypothetical protein